MTRWQSDKAKYSRITSWRVVEKPTPMGQCLRILAMFADGSERLVQGTFKTREQLDRYVDRFLPHLQGRESVTEQPVRMAAQAERAAAVPEPVSSGLSEDQQGFVAFVEGVTEEQLRSTYKSYSFLADFGRADDIFKRDACRSEFLRRGLDIPVADQTPGDLPNLLEGADPA